MIDPRYELQYFAVHRNHDQRFLSSPSALQRIAAGIRLGLPDAVTIYPAESLGAMKRPQITSRIDRRNAHMKGNHHARRDRHRARPRRVRNGGVISALENKPEQERPERDHYCSRLPRHPEHRGDGEAEQYTPQQSKRESIAQRAGSSKQQHRHDQAPPEHRHAADEAEFGNDVPKPILGVVGTNVIAAQLAEIVGQTMEHPDTNTVDGMRLDHFDRRRAIAEPLP